MTRAAKPTTLKQRSEFLAVAASGKKWVTPGVIVQVGATPIASNNRDELQRACRYGITASKRVGNAVQRNRAKRRLRALAREVLAFHSSEEHDYVLIARPATVTRVYAELRGDLITALKRLKAWKETES